jgi:hypothetical protein
VFREHKVIKAWQVLEHKAYKAFKEIRGYLLLVHRVALELLAIKAYKETKVIQEHKVLVLLEYKEIRELPDMEHKGCRGARVFKDTQTLQYQRQRQQEQLLMVHSGWW